MKLNVAARPDELCQRCQDCPFSAVGVSIRKLAKGTARFDGIPCMILCKWRWAARNSACQNTSSALADSVVPMCSETSPFFVSEVFIGYATFLRLVVNHYRSTPNPQQTIGWIRSRFPPIKSANFAGSKARKSTKALSFCRVFFQTSPALPLM